MIFRSPFCRRDKRREKPAPLFTEGPRAEVARGGTPSVGGPRAELKLMDKGRQPRNFRWINRAVLLCVIEVFLGPFRTLVSFDSFLPRFSRAHGTFYRTWNSYRDWTENFAWSFHERFIRWKNEQGIVCIWIQLHVRTCI